MDVRRLVPSDASAMRELRLRALHEHPEAFTSSWQEDARLPLARTEQRLADGATAIWGAFAGDSLCGMVGLEHLQRDKERHKARVVAMYVMPEAGGRGVGQALLSTVIAHARGEGLGGLVLTVTQGNAAAQRLYERAGFKVFGVEPDAIRVDGASLAKVHMHLCLRE